MLKTPILLLVFNRPEHTSRVLAAIRKAQPAQLFVVADGPRANVPADYEKCQAVRMLFQDGIDWDCDVKFLLREENVGCKKGVTAAITWFFEQVEEGIILEDDVLPADDFFPFCEQLLERYRDNPEIGVIAGDNFQFGRKRGDGSYYFSIYPHCWGWATWRRAWALYDYKMEAFPSGQDGAFMDGIVSGPDEKAYWLNVFHKTWNGEIDSWNYRWVFANWMNRGLTILPNVNLTSNIGFGADGTHCGDASSLIANKKTGELKSLLHPAKVQMDREADRFTFEHIFAGRPVPPMTIFEKRQADLWQARQTGGTRNGQSETPVITLAPPSGEQLPNMTPQQIQDEACAKFQAGDAAGALKLAKLVEKLVPGAPQAIYLQALCLARVGHHSDALPLFERVLAVVPDNAEVRAKYEGLKKALTLPEQPRVPIEKRDWRTGLPRDLLLRMQQSLHNFNYKGVDLLKNPFDLALYTRLIWQEKPRTIIEIGSESGGSGLWMADLLDSYGIDGHIWSLDIIRVEDVTHPRLTFVEANGRKLGETLSPAVLEQLPRPWLVIEDADHEYETSKAVLDFFHPWLREGEYIVVEDGIISDLVNDPKCNSGPHRAIKEFLGVHGHGYEMDTGYCDFFGHNMTWCTNGFLRKTGMGTAPSAVDSQTSLDQARQLLNGGQVQQGLGLLNDLKAHGVLAEGLDYLRAVGFLLLSNGSAAIEALKEELNHFPGNAAAKEWLAKLSAQRPAVPSKAEAPQTPVAQRQAPALPLLPRTWTSPCELTPAGEPSGAAVAKGSLLNLGCGGHFHTDWINVDLAPCDARVRQHDLTTRLPFNDSSFAAVYHSHVLEHLPRGLAKPFMQECFRVLEPGGILRVAVPDLETIARLYLRYLQEAADGDRTAANRHEWMLLELLDQMTRESAGGDMLRYLMRNPAPAEDLVIERMGPGFGNFMQQVRAQSPQPNALAPAERVTDPVQLGRFRLSGEVHKWMYDRLSLKDLMEACGFSQVAVCAANESKIADFNRYQLDTFSDGTVRKPDSLFMEAVKA